MCTAESSLQGKASQLTAERYRGGGQDYHLWKEVSTSCSRTRPPGLRAAPQKNRRKVTLLKAIHK